MSFVGAAAPRTCLRASSRFCFWVSAGAADNAVNKKIAAEVADHDTGAHPLGKVKQRDAVTDLDRRDKDVEAHPLLGWVLLEALSDLVVHRWLATGHVQTVW
jgi:hypothetical protein